MCVGGVLIMADTPNYQWPPVRRKKPVSKWKRFLHKYWPPIRFGLIILAFVGLICLIIALIVSCGKKDETPDVTEPVVQTEPTMSPEQISDMGKALMKEAEMVAAGYDYQKAIQMLRDFEFYDSMPDMAEAAAEYEALDLQLVPYENMYEITHVFFHALVVDTARAFDDDYTNAGYNQYMTTIDEFVAMMEEMYNRGYVLVSPYDVAYEVTDATGTHFTYGEIRLPEGKKPFIMSQDDVNYYGYMIGAVEGVNEIPAFPDTTGDGFAHKIVIGADGYPTCEYMDENGNITTGDYDLVPVLEKFIQEHPDFSYHGARAVLGMTGYEGVFGYRTKPSYEGTMGTEAYQKEIEDAKKVAQCLRDHGWILASHSYGHPSYGQISAEKVRIDSQKWEDTVQPVIGDCDIILYPNGSDVAGVEKYTFDNEKFAAMYEHGYRYFFNVDGHQYWNQLGDNYYRGGRRNLDGYRLYYNPEMLEDLFDANALFDPARPTPVPPI